MNQTLESVYKSVSGIETEVFVVDNNSFDGSSQMVRSTYPDVILIENSENQGFSKANNIAIRRAKGDYVLILNPDTVVQEDTFQTLINFLEEHPEAGAASCKVLNADGTLQLACRRSTPTPLVVLPKILGLSALFPKSKLLAKYNLTYLDEDELSEVDAVSGSFVMVRKSVIEEVGLFDEDFFMYGEDLDWFFRMRKAGYKIYYVPYTKIIHYKGESSRAAGYDSIRMFYKSQIQFVRKHFSKSKSVFAVMFLYFGIVLRALLSYVVKTGVSLAPLMMDTVLMQLSLLLAIRIKFGSFNEIDAYILIGGIYTAVWLLSFYIVGIYKRRRFSATYAAWGVILGFFVNTTFTFFFNQFAYSREVLIWLLLLNIIVIPAWRIGIRLARKTGLVPFFGTLGKTMILRRTAIVGSEEEARRITRKILDRIEYGYSIEGFIDKKSPDSLLENPTYLGKVTDIDEIVSARKITDIIFSTESYSYEEVLDIIAKVKHNKMNFKIVPKQMDFIIGKSSVESIEEISFIDIEFNIDKLFNRIIKRSLDLIISSLLLILLSPFALISFLFFGRSIRGVELLLQNNQVGKVYFLSKTENIQSGILTRYPLLLLVLTGKLSIVGRDLLLQSSKTQEIHCKPGLMSLAEIMSRGNRDKNEHEKYEQYYLRNQSLQLDLEIIIKALFNL